METKEIDALASIREAMNHPDVSLHFPYVFSHGHAVQVYIKTRKIGPFILPSEDQTLSDVVAMLMDMR